MGFKEAVKTCMSKYATFSGRARRSEFWWFDLFVFLDQLPFQIAFFVLYVVAIFPAVQAAGPEGDVETADVSVVPLVIGVGLLGLAILVLLLPSYAVWVRRLHDMGQPGLWVLLSFVGLGIVPLIMAFLDTQPGDNQWGPDPKADERNQWANAQYGGPLEQPGPAAPPPGPGHSDPYSAPPPPAQ